MAAKPAKELRRGNESQITRTGKGSNTFSERRYTRTFLVETTNSADPASVALQAFGLPEIGDSYVSGSVQDSGARVVSIRPERESAKSWTVRVEYSTETNDQEDQDPLNMTPVMSFEFETFRVPIIGELDQDAAGNANKVFKGAMQNAAGEIFNPPPMMDESRPVLKVVKNSAFFDPIFAMSFQDAVNIAPWGGASERQVKVNRISTPGIKTEKINDVEIAYYPVTYELHYKRETWDIQVLNQGWYYLSAAGADPTVPDSKIPFKDGDGNPTKGLLAEDGTALADGAIPTYIRKKAYKELDFNLLGLPEAFF